MVSLGLIFLSLSIYKAAHTAFTHDESFTYLTYVKKNFVGIVNMEDPVSANNHLLNTLLMKVIDKLIAPTPFHLRLPNILAHLIFILFSVLIVQVFKNNYFKVIGFVMINANIYLIDLFALARGYGLSLGFLMMHWYFLSQTISNYANKTNFKLTVFSLFLAILSNFSIIYYGISLFIFWFIKILIFKLKYIQANLTEIKGQLIYLMSLGLLGIVFVYLPVIKLIKYNQLYFGGTNNFLQDTLYSLVFYSLTSSNPSERLIEIVFAVVLIVFCLLFILMILNFFKNIFTLPTLSNLAVLCIFICLQVIFFKLFDTKYLIQRTAIFLIPIFTLTVLYVLNDFNIKFLYVLSGITAAILLFFTLRFVPLSSSLNWRYDSDNETLLADLKSNYFNSNRANKISVGVDWIFQPSLNYYRATTDARSWLDTITKDGYEKKIFNYYFVESSSIDKFVDTSQFKVLKTYHNSQNLLIKNLKFE